MCIKVLIFLSILLTFSQASYQWLPFNDTNENHPANAVKGGHSDDGRILYIIRKVFEDKTLFGDTLDFKEPYVIDVEKDEEIAAPEYEVSDFLNPEVPN
jgi:hypothetical protein